MVEKLKIGWIGLGKMGNPISRNLLKAGYPLTVYNVVQSATAELAREGAKPADSSKAVASDTGRAMDVPMPFTALTRQFYAVMKAQGKADLDYFGLAALAQEMAGLKD